MLEQIYQDFITKALPQIQTGLQITKEYFTELFGRYVKYLIAIDAAWLVAGIILLIITIVFINKYWNVACKTNAEAYDVWPVFYFAGIIISIVISAAVIMCNITNLFKDIYIPEIRIMQEIQYLTAHNDK